MLWALNEDQITLDAVQRMRKLYPTEAAVRLDNMRPDRELKEKNGSTPSRISCFAHGAFGTYAGYEPQDLAEEIIGRLINSAKINPQIKQTLTDFDLFGCMVGCDNGKDPTYIEQLQKRVNDRLGKEGFQQINFKAVTNKVLGPEKPMHVVMFTPLETSDGYVVKGIATEKNLETYLSTKQQIKTLSIEEDRWEKNAGGNGLTIKEEMTALFKKYNVKKPVNSQDPFLSACNYLMEEYKSYKSSPQINADLSRLEILMQRYARLQEIPKELEKLETKHQACYTLIHEEFKDPRKLVDSHPQCNFTKAANNKQASKFSEYKARFEKMTEKSKESSTPQQDTGSNLTFR